MGFAPDARADPEREHERSETGAAVPPPRRQPVRVGVAGGANGGAGADVGGEERREEQTGAERPARNEEPGALTHRPADPGAEGDQADRIDGEQNAEDRHAGGSADVGRGRVAGQALARRARRGRWRRRRLPRPARRRRRRSPRGPALPVASAKSVSPSDGVCDGTIARARPSCAISTTFSACAFVSRALVATTPIVVVSRAGPADATPCRTSANGSSSERPSAVRTPATGRPVRGSTTGPDGIDGDDRADDQAVGVS